MDSVLQYIATQLSDIVNVVISFLKHTFVVGNFKNHNTKLRIRRYGALVLLLSWQRSKAGHETMFVRASLPLVNSVHLNVLTKNVFKVLMACSRVTCSRQLSCTFELVA